MANWHDVIIKSCASIHDAISVIDKGSRQIAIVVSDDGHLLGTITDGDIRRGLLKGVQLSDAIEKVMNKLPVTLPPGSTNEQIYNTMREKNIRQMLIVNNGVIKNLITWDDFNKKPSVSNKVVLMAGGMGTRLRPLTETCPKPLIEVGQTPIIETVIRNFAAQGFDDIVISVNYKGEMVKEFCGDGSKFGVCISYIDEDKRLGTAGALSLIEEEPTKPFIVMNADLLTRINFSQFMDFHKTSEALATMAVREYSFEVPYGVVQTEGVRLTQIVEKPQQNFFVNAGIYILQPELIDKIPKNEFFDMPQLFDLLIAEEKNVAAFPIREYWIDIGQAQELDRANSDYQKIFAINNG